MKRERERANTDLESSSTFSLVVLTRVFLQGSILTAARPDPNCFLNIILTRSQLNPFPVFPPTSSALWRFRWSSLQLIRTRCLFAADTFLFLTRVSSIICACVSMCDRKHFLRTFYFNKDYLNTGLLSLIKRKINFYLTIPDMRINGAKVKNRGLRYIKENKLLQNSI